MIIKFTLNNSKYTQIIERYFDYGGPFVITYYNSDKEYKNFLKDVKTLNDFKYFSSEKEEFKTHIVKIIKQNFINYINRINENNIKNINRFNAKTLIHKQIILKNINISLVNLIVDKSRNNEVVYYIDFIRKYITV